MRYVIHFNPSFFPSFADLLVHGEVGNLAGLIAVARGATGAFLQARCSELVGTEGATG